jgi:hypothetical protein
MPIHTILSDVRTLHPELHVATGPSAVPSYGVGGDPEFQSQFNVCPTDPAVLCTSSMIKKLCSEKKNPDKIAEGQKWGGHHEKHHGSSSNHPAADS